MISKKKTGISAVFVLFLCGCSAWAYADVPFSDDTYPLPQQGWQITGLAGIADLNTSFSNEAVINTPFPPINNTLTGHTDSAAFAPGLGVAYNFVTAPYTQVGNSYWLQSVSLGVNAYYLGGSRDGLVNVGGDPSFQNNAYNANVNSFRIMLDGEFNFHPIWRFIPFAEVGVGDAVNSLNYSESTTPGSFPLALANVDGSSNNFAYEVGGGVKLPVNEDSIFSLRYLYSNMGSVQADNSPILAQPIEVNMHASSLFLGYTYAF
jgi:opacity protein-like surface antigen